MSKEYKKFSFSCRRVKKYTYSFTFNYEFGKTLNGSKTMEIKANNMKKAKKLGEKYFLRKLLEGELK